MALKDFNIRLNKTRDVMSLEEYLEKAKTDPSLYASPQERLLKAIGSPKLVDTSKDERLSRIFGNKLVKVYSSFSNFYGLETVIEKIVNYLVFGSQNLEERKQILYLFGPPGSAKSSLADHLKYLMEQEPFYSLAIEVDKKLEISPIHESPLGLFNKEDAADLGLPERLFDLIPSPWAIKRLDECGDITKFKVVKLYPSKLRQIAIGKTEPGDENNQDISTLVGKLDIRKLEKFPQNDPDAYRFSGGLCIANRGILDFVEMFKAPINMLNPLLEATQGKNYNATEALAPLPFDGIVLAHSNEAEFETFRNNKNNEAFLDRIYLVKVPYCLRIQEEKKIYRKQLKESSLAKSPCVEHTLDILAKFAILTRLIEPENSDIYLKLPVYDGQKIKDKHPNAKSLQEYLEESPQQEGFKGLSTRAAYKLLSQAFNYDASETAADPIHMLMLIEKYINEQEFPESISDKWLSFIKDHLSKEYYYDLGKDIQAACVDSYEKFGQHILDKYIKYADFWLQEQDYRDPDTGQMLDDRLLNSELEVIEKKAGINNAKDFRNEVVHFCLRYQAKNNGENPSWRSYNKMKEVIESSLFKDIKKVIEVISFENVKDKEQKKKNEEFIKKMIDKGYTEKQVKRNVEWYNRNPLSKK